MTEPQIIRTPGGEELVVLTGAKQEFAFPGYAARPVLSINRGFSAPVTIESDVSPEDLVFLAAHDDDPFARYEAMQSLIVQHLVADASGQLDDGQRDAGRAARVVQALSSSRPIQGAARKRAFDTSWPACFIRAPNRRSSLRSSRTMASVGVDPALVPPSTTRSKPSGARLLTSNPAAAALARRAPSRCSPRPAAFAGRVRALSCTVE